MSRFFFNDVEVTEAEYNRLCENAATEAEASEILPLRKVAKRPAPAVSEVLTPAKPVEKAKKGSKTDIAAEIVRRLGTGDKAACVEAIVAALGVTKANANCYFFNVVKKGLA